MKQTNTVGSLQSRALFAALPFSEQAMLSYKGVSPAARRWLLGFLGGLDFNEKKVHVFGHQIASIFPVGRLIPGNFKNIVDDYPFLLLRYLNLWPFRWESLIRSYEKGFDRAMVTWGRFDYVFSYNPWPNQLAMGRHAKSRDPSTKWILITLDYEDPDENFKTFLHITKGVDYYVFLSQWAYDNIPIKNKYLLEGGVKSDLIQSRYELRCNAIKTKYSQINSVILYTGMFDKWGGLSILLEAFMGLPGDDIELWICGFGNDDYIKSAISKDARIKLHGLVSDEKLDQLSQAASLFVNPRPVYINGNMMNFPSKILEYLTYCKPVISTLTPGLLNEYKEVCHIVDTDPSSIRNGIIEVLSKDQENLLDTASGIYSFLQEKTWERQIEGLLLWIDTEKT
jgi:glycosyltransferase involved in cell wall biosynthesis